MKTTTWNTWFTNNLFWIVPVFFLFLVGDIIMGFFHGNKSIENQEEIKVGVHATVRNDSLQLANQDSMKQSQRIMLNGDSERLKKQDSLLKLTMPVIKDFIKN